MIEFIYTQIYRRNHQRADAMIIPAKDFAIAVKYQVPALRAAAAARFEADVPMADLETFMTAAKLVYSTTPEEVRELREVVIEAMHRRHHTLENPAVKRAMIEIPELAYGVLLRAYGKGISGAGLKMGKGFCECGHGWWFVKCETCG